MKKNKTKKASREDSFTIVNKTKSKIPDLPFLLMKNAVLGKKYNLSLVITGDAELLKLNKIYRQKNSTTDVLSFPLSAENGEIFLNPRDAKRQAPLFDFETLPFIGFLFIHGMLHLKGYNHGSTMEDEETKFVKKFRLLTSPQISSWRKKLLLE